MAVEELADLVAVDAKPRALNAELKTAVLARGSHLMDIHGVRPRARLASWTGTGPGDITGVQQTRRRLSRAGNRRMKMVRHIAATAQMRINTEGGATTSDRKLGAGQARMEACAA